MKISASTYSFKRLGISQFQIIDLAKELGFDAVEIVGLDITEEYQGRPLDYAKALKAYADSKDMPLSSYTVGADFLADNVVENLKNELEIAKILGVPSMRHDIVWYLPDNVTYFDLFPDIVPKIREVTEYAKALGIKTCTENHGYVSQDAERVVSLVKAVDNPNFGLLVDIGNFMVVDEVSCESVKKVAPYAFYVHAKDFLFLSKEDAEKQCVKGEDAVASVQPEGYIKTRHGNFLTGCAVGDGVVDSGACIKILKDSGYDGYVALEYEGKFKPALDEIKRGKAFLDKALAL